MENDNDERMIKLQEKKKEDEESKSKKVSNFFTFLYDERSGGLVISLVVFSFRSCC